MKVLLSGGVKTENIVTSIEKKFQASGDEFLVVQFLDDINEIFVRGDNFDKAIITEQSITREYSIKDEMTIRNRVSNFVEECLNRSGKYSYIFLTQNEKLAEMIHEEILPILQCSNVVLYTKKYTVSFFTTIIRSDVKQLPKDIVYVPKPIEDVVETGEQIEDVGISDEDMESSEYNPYVIDTSMDITSQIFNTDVPGISDDARVTGIDIDSGDGIFVDIDESELEGIRNYGESTMEPMGQTDGTYMDESVMEPMESMDDTYMDESYNDYIPEDTVKKSKALPTVDVPVATDDFIGSDTMDESMNMGMTEQNDYSFIDETLQGNLDAPLEGFDDDTSSNDNYMDDSMYNPIYNQAPSMDSGFDESFYGGNDQSGNDSSADMNMGTGMGEGMGAGMAMGTAAGMAMGMEIGQNNGPSLADELYGMTDNRPTMQFSGEDYGVPEADNTEYDKNIDEQVYNPDDPFNSTDYANMGNGGNQANMLQQTQQQGTKKKGLLGGLFGKKHNNVAAEPVEQTRIEETTSKESTSNSTVKKVREALKPFAARGNSIMVTGCGGCGTSVIAMNLANIISQLGYTVLLVDFDTESKAQSYISKLQYESMDPEGSNLISAVNSSVGVTGQVTVVKSGFNLLTMGMASDSVTLEESIHKEKINRFANVVKSSYNFVIYDAGFKNVTGFLSELTYISDNIVMVTDASNWGVTKMMLAMCNIADDDIQSTLFTRAQILFNKYRNTNRILGNKVRTCADITKVMDKKVMELMGEVQDCSFEEMHIAGIINDDIRFEDGWFEKVQYSDTEKGQKIFLEVIERIVLKK